MQPDPDISELKLIAYQLHEPNLELVVAPGSRAWMDATTNRFANRCLPLRIANQAGWFVLNAEPVEALWHGGDQLADVDVSVQGKQRHLAPISHFGYGVLTWSIPYLFRTPPGYNLVVRGPANWCKDGIVPLDGIVETDWALATFTMNWKFTRPGLRVRFEAGEPICMIFPQKRHEIESFHPEIRGIESVPEIGAGYRKWSESRDQFSKETHEAGASVPSHLSWQKHYFHGHAPSGDSAPEHQVKLEICPFLGAKPPAGESEEPAPSEWRKVSPAPDPDPAVIPRILHQTWRSNEIPEKWRAWRESWKTHNPGWELMFWTDATGREFIAAHYPWFLDIYDEYREPIMRADAVRYFLLNHYGGVYADLDYECLKPFETILQGRRLVMGCEPPEHARTREVREAGLSWLVCNALMASIPGHPFWDQVFRQLLNSRLSRGPLEATGPIMLTRAYESFTGRSSICLLDSHVLSPLTQPEAHCGRWLEPAFRERIAERAWAVHHWTNTWVRKSSRFPPLDKCPVHLLRNRRVVMQGALRTDVLGDVDNMLAGPLISCLMVTRGRVDLAALSIRSFRSQTYKDRELVILDDSGDGALETHVKALGDPAIRYIALEPQGQPMGQSLGQSLGELRNRAVEASLGEFIAQWDDDDLSHPRRLELQMAAVLSMGADASFLLREMIWWPREQRLAIGRSRVWESSMLCRKEALPAYPEKRMGEDTPVVARLMREKKIALLDAPQLYVYVRHGANTFGESHFERQWTLADMQFEGPAYDETLDLLGEYYRFGDYPIKSEIAPKPVLLRKPSKTASGDNSACDFDDRRILILTPVKNAARCLPRYFENLRKLLHPHCNISLGFLESDSSDESYEVLQAEEGRLAQEFRRVTLLRRPFDFYPPGNRWEPSIQRERRSILARSRNELLMRTLDDEDWVLWMDADISDYPPDIIVRLLSYGKQIITPDTAHEDGGWSFDLNTFQLTGDPTALDESVHTAGTLAPRGDGRRYLSELRNQEIVPVDSIGGVLLLVDASLHRSGLIFPPFPYKNYLETEGLAVMAKDMGVQAWGLPNLQVLHPRQ